MRIQTAVLSGVLVGAGALAAGRAMASFQDEPPAKDPSCAMAFVDTRKVMMTHPKWKELDERLRAEYDLLTDGLGKREAEIRKRGQDLEARLSPGTPAYETERKNMEMLLQEWQYDKKAGQDRLGRKRVLGMGQIFQDVRAEAERIATERGFACVFDIDTEPLRVEEKGQFMSVTELRLQMGMRPVIWCREELDLTQAALDAVLKSAPAPGTPDPKVPK